DPAKWSATMIPDSATATADFLTPLAASAAAHIQLNGNRALSRLTINSPGTYSIDPGSNASSMLTLGSVAAAGKIDILQGSHAITASLHLANDLIIEVRPDATLTLN